MIKEKHSQKIAERANFMISSKKEFSGACRIIACYGIEIK
ncbi:MAG: hypothetical protein UW88_C0016G0023 [Candidatus Collierbacteria bacterium GW2011_GWD2_45_10]|nr:MAG: hypothetical protein UW31_C0018G0003 [Candidatus Collierbacteria bacterium GW2011_GWA2_44_13]KKT62064.1 MAG: hypothetical protein UW56_C0012G0003 [Candidatus Collierbacteria bacterium GW2011_GWD1_44_27]KKT88058.1 MAG: hypothetical protein UW88_C0016G0023 [Candidatus Collierbacteria bacterium GW2011_GWD2_45_10]